MLKNRAAVLFKRFNTVEDWFNTYPGYLQYVSWCTNVWLMFMHVDVTIGHMSWCESHRHINVENSRFA